MKSGAVFHLQDGDGSIRCQLGGGRGSGNAGADDNDVAGLAHDLLAVRFELDLHGDPIRFSLGFAIGQNRVIRMGTRDE